MAKINNDILTLWKQLTPEKKVQVLERIYLKALGVELEPLRLEEMHPRTCRVDEVPPSVKGA